MAWLEYITYSQLEYSAGPSDNLATQLVPRPPLENLPQIYWENGEPWDEANVWSLDSKLSGNLHMETIQRKMRHLCDYANFLEAKGLDWRSFPIKKADRVLWKFRGHLIKMRDEGLLASSTVSACMNVVIAYYRFAALHELVRPEGPMWQDRQIMLTTVDPVGFQRTMLRTSTDLTILNVKRADHIVLEGGLVPLRADELAELLAFTAHRSPAELHMMLSTGFLTGARVGSIVTFTVSCLYTAREDRTFPGAFKLPVGPGTDVATKGSAQGEILVPRAFLSDLKKYATSVERLKREAKAPRDAKDVLFLTCRGTPFSIDTVGSLVREMRAKAVAENMHFMQRFKFHDSRATFGTNFATILLDHFRPAEALQILKNAMLHKREKDTLNYIKFRERTAAKEAAAKAYSEMFTGIRGRDWDAQDA